MPTGKQRSSSEFGRHRSAGRRGSGAAFMLLREGRK